MPSPAFRRLGEGQSEEEEQPSPSISHLACMSGMEETGGPAPALSPIQNQSSSHAHKDSKFVTSVVRQQRLAARRQEAEIQTHRRTGAGRPAGSPAPGHREACLGARLAQRLQDSGCHGHACLLFRSQVHMHSPGVLALSFHAKTICPCPHRRLL